MAGFVPVLALLGVLAVGLGVADRLLSGATLRRRRRAPADRTTTGQGRTRRPLHVVAADLRRLSRQFALVPAGAPLVRWRALWAAYDAVLMEAADQLEIGHELPTTPMGMPRDLERLRLQAALEGAGLVVRD